MRAAVVGLSLTSAFALGRASRPSPISPPAAAATQDGADEPSHTRRTNRPRVPALRVAETASPADGCEPRDHRASATYVVDSLLARLPHGPAVAGDVPETGANSVRPFLQGMVEAIKQTAPAVRSALAEELAGRLCGGGLKDDQLITMGYLAQELPDIGSARGFDCVFAQRGNQEDMVLWSMLDAWRQSGQPKTPTIARLEASATDPRTQRRFMSPEAELSMRSSARSATQR